MTTNILPVFCGWSTIRMENVLCAQPTIRLSCSRKRWVANWCNTLPLFSLKGMVQIFGCKTEILNLKNPLYSIQCRAHSYSLMTARNSKMIAVRSIPISTRA